MQEIAVRLPGRAAVGRVQRVSLSFTHLVHENLSFSSEEAMIYISYMELFSTVKMSIKEISRRGVVRMALIPRKGDLRARLAGSLRGKVVPGHVGRSLRAASDIVLPMPLYRRRRAIVRSRCPFPAGTVPNRLIFARGCRPAEFSTIARRRYI